MPSSSPSPPRTSTTGNHAAIVGVTTVSSRCGAVARWRGGPVGEEGMCDPGAVAAGWRCKVTAAVGGPQQHGWLPSLLLAVVAAAAAGRVASRQAGARRSGRAGKRKDRQTDVPNTPPPLNPLTADTLSLRQPQLSVTPRAHGMAANIRSSRTQCTSRPYRAARIGRGGGADVVASTTLAAAGPPTSAPLSPASSHQQPPPVFSPPLTQILFSRVVPQ